MKIKPKGRKIYRRKDRFEHLKHIRHNIGSVIMTLAIAGALGFVGYSAGAPVLRFLQERNFLAPPSQYRQTVTAENTNTEPPETEIATEALTESETIPEETEPEIIETKSEIGFRQKAPNIQGYLLDVSALSTEADLKSALEAIPEGITHVIVPLKIRGGEIWYATSVRDAARSNAVQAFLSLNQIYEMIKESGYESAALINLLEDPLFAGTYPDASYLFQSGELWMDQSEVEPQLWLNPSSVLTQEYLSEIAEEIETAGFSILICDGLQYPNFPRSDLPLLAPECSEENRYQHLTELLTEMRRKAPEIAFLIRTDGENALSGELETVYAAEELPADCLLFTLRKENRNHDEALTELSEVVPVMIEWQSEEVPKGSKIKSYVLNPEN